LLHQRVGSFDGIIAYLTWKCGGNVDDCQIFAVTCSEAHPSSPANNATDLNNDSFFCSTHSRSHGNLVPHVHNNWICYDFKGRRIILTHYVVPTYGAGAGGNHIKSWLIERSTDGQCWSEIDHKENDSILNRPGTIRKFPVTRSCACHFIRLVNIRVNYGGYDSLIITAWEIFGILIEWINWQWQWTLHSSRHIHRPSSTNHCFDFTIFRIIHPSVLRITVMRPEVSSLLNQPANPVIHSLSA
jgi:hypothetical protein